MTPALLFGTLLWLACLWLFRRGGAASAFHPLGYYLFFHGLVFVVRPWLGWWYGYRFIYRVFEFSPTPGERITALLAADLGLACFTAAALWAGGGPLAVKPDPVARGHLHRRHRGALWVAAALCAPLGLWSLAHGVAAKLGGGDGLAMDPATGIYVNTASNGYLSDAHAMLIPLVVLLPWLHRFRWPSLVPFAGYAAARAVMGGGRWAFLMAAAALALFTLYERRARWWRWQALALGLAVMTPFTLLGQDRDYFRHWLGAAPEPVQVAALHPLEDENYANQEFLEYVVRAVPGRTGGYDWFLDNLQLFTEPVPRALWPGKPVGPPIQPFRLFDYGRPVGMTLSLPGEGWVQAGWPGVAIWCGLWGWACGAIHRWFARSRQTEFEVAAYLLLLPLSVQLFRDGTLISAARFPLFYLVPLGLWWLLARAGGRRIARVPVGWAAA